MSHTLTHLLLFHFLVSIHTHLRQETLGNTGWPKGTRCLIFVCVFPQKSHQVWGIVAERDLQKNARRYGLGILVSKRPATKLLILNKATYPFRAPAAATISETLKLLGFCCRRGLQKKGTRFRKEIKPVRAPTTATIQKVLYKLGFFCKRAPLVV